MSNQIVPFDFEGHQVRVEPRDDDTVYIAKDVCSAMDLGNVTEAIRGLDEDEIRTAEVIDSIGRTQQVPALTEAGVYQLAFKSRKEAAKRFRRWLAHKVIPSIRKTGGYVAPGREEEFLAALTALTTEVKALHEWRSTVEAAHPFGTMGTRDAKILAGQFRAIRDLMIANGDRRNLRSLSLVIDRAVRAEAAYPKEKGKRWQHATSDQAKRAFAFASQWIDGLQTDLKCRPPVEPAKQSTIDFAAEKARRATEST